MSKTNPNSESNQPIILPHRPTWAIADLVFSVIGHTRQARRDLIGRLGYTDKGKAASRFDAMIRTGDVKQHIRQTLPQALNVDPSLVITAVVETRTQQARYARVLAAHQEAIDRDLFTPGIHIKTDIRKRKLGIGILVFCDDPGVREIAVPTYVPAQSEKVQLALVRSLIEEFPTTKAGKRYNMLFAEPASYIYCPTYDEAWELSATLEIIQRFTGPVAPDCGGVRIANKWIYSSGVPIKNRSI
jgi:hypothetical protein